MSYAFVNTVMRRFVRSLLVAVTCAVLGLWPSAAVAGITCKTQHYLVCDRTECCFFTCVVCVDADGNVLGISCDDGTCYPKEI